MLDPSTQAMVSDESSAAKWCTLASGMAAGPRSGGDHEEVGRVVEKHSLFMDIRCFVVVKVNHRIIGMRLPLGRIVTGVVEFLEVGFIDVARDVLAVETTGIKGCHPMWVGA